MSNSNESYSAELDRLEQRRFTGSALLEYHKGTIKKLELKESIRHTGSVDISEHRKGGALSLPPTNP